MLNNYIIGWIKNQRLDYKNIKKWTYKQKKWNECDRKNYKIIFERNRKIINQDSNIDKKCKKL